MTAPTMGERMHSKTKVTVLAATALVLTLAGSTAAGAWGGGSDGGSYGSSYGGYRDGNVRFAASYINRDTGTATENSNINSNSSCFTPDRYDEFQKVSPVGSVAKNVHNDACLLDDRGNKIDGGATYESYGVGNISACPDPDNAGPRFARLGTGPTGKALTSCIQSGYQVKNMAGDKEFHARLNSTQPGQQTVVWCYDKALNGCFDDNIQDTIVINWVA